MNILFLSNLYPPYVRGGAEYLAAQVTGELVRQGHRVSVLTTAPWKSLKHLRRFNFGFTPELREEAGVRVYRMFPCNLYHYLSAAKYPLPFRLVWQLVNLWNAHTAHVSRRILRTEQPELVVSFNLMGLGFNLPRALAKLGAKHVHVLHDVQLLHPSGLFMWGREPKGLFTRTYQALTRRLFEPVGTVVSPSTWLMREHEQRGFFSSSRRLVLSNPVPPAQAAPEIKRAHAPLKLIYVGQFSEHKGLYWLVEALSQVKRTDFELHLLSTTHKPDTVRLRKLIAGDARVTVHDLVSQAEIDAAYASAHLTLVPSLCYENSPTAITKSLSSGTPVLAAALGGIPEFIEPGKTGWLFQPADVKDFIKQLNWCLDNPAALLQAGLAGSRAFSQRTLEWYAKELVSL